MHYSSSILLYLFVRPMGLQFSDSCIAVLIFIFSYSTCFYCCKFVVFVESFYHETLAQENWATTPCVVMLNKLLLNYNITTITM